MPSSFRPSTEPVFLRSLHATQGSQMDDDDAEMSTAAYEQAYREQQEVPTESAPNPVIAKSDQLFKASRYYHKYVLNSPMLAPEDFIGRRFGRLRKLLRDNSHIRTVRETLDPDILQDLQQKGVIQA